MDPVSEVNHGYFIIMQNGVRKKAKNVFSIMKSDPLFEMTALFCHRSYPVQSKWGDLSSPSPCVKKCHFLEQITANDRPGVQGAQAVFDPTASRTEKLTQKRRDDSCPL